MADPLPLDLRALAVALQSLAFNTHLIAFDLASKIGGRPALAGAYRLSGAVARDRPLAARTDRRGHTRGA